jgi:hypothetical protein
MELHNGKKPSRPPNGLITDTLWNIINACWADTPTDRPTMEKVWKYIKHLLILESARTEMISKSTDNTCPTEVPVITHHICGALHALEHVRVNADDIRLNLEQMTFSSHDYFIQTAFNNDLASNGVGLLEEIHIFLRTDPEKTTAEPTVPIQAIAHKLGLLFSPFPGSVVMADMAVSTPVFATGSDKVISFEEVKRDRMLRISDAGALSDIQLPCDFNGDVARSTSAPSDQQIKMQSTGGSIRDGSIRDGGSVYMDNEENGKSRATTGHGGEKSQQTGARGNGIGRSNIEKDNNGKEKGRAAEEQEGDKDLQTETDGDDPEDPTAESPYNKTAGFIVILHLHDARNEFQQLHASGRIKSKVCSCHSALSTLTSRRPFNRIQTTFYEKENYSTLQSTFHHLRFQSDRRHKASNHYHHQFARVTIDTKDNAYFGNYDPKATAACDRTEKINNGEKALGNLTINANTKAGIGGTFGFAAEGTRNREVVKHNSRIRTEFSEGDRFSWQFAVDDNNEKEDGLELIGERLPRLEAVYHDPCRPQTNSKITLESLWSWPSRTESWSPTAFWSLPLSPPCPVLGNLYQKIEITMPSNLEKSGYSRLEMHACLPRTPGPGGMRSGKLSGTSVLWLDATCKTQYETELTPL